MIKVLRGHKDLQVMLVLRVTQGQLDLKVVQVTKVLKVVKVLKVK